MLPSCRHTAIIEPVKPTSLPIDETKQPIRYVQGLTPIQHVAVRYLAAGWSPEKVAEAMKLPTGVVRKWQKNDPKFVMAYQQAVVHQADLVEALLLVGEREAARTLIEALEAKRGDQPNWPVRVQAAMSLMDRAGERGRATEKQQVAQVTAHVQANAGSEEALRRALRDPGVRTWLKDSGQLQLIEANATISPISAPTPSEPAVEINFYTEPPDQDGSSPEAA